jgi:hypothetical protein
LTFGLDDRFAGRNRDLWQFSCIVQGLSNDFGQVSRGVRYHKSVGGGNGLQEFILAPGLGLLGPWRVTPGIWVPEMAAEEVSVSPISKHATVRHCAETSSRDC